MEAVKLLQMLPFQYQIYFTHLFITPPQSMTELEVETIQLDLYLLL